MDNCGGQSYDGVGNMAGRYAGVLTLIQHQSLKFKLLSYGQIYFWWKQGPQLLDRPLLVN